MTAKVRSGLGRGLGALLGEAAEAPESPARDEVKNLKLTDIDPNRGQPRERFDEGALRELAESIKSVGVLQPILVRQTGDRYEIIAGERRWRAAQEAGLKSVPVILREAADQDAAVFSLIENLLRANLNPIEEAEAYHRLINEFGLSHEALSATVGKDRSTVTNALRLLKLPKEIREAIAKKTLSAGHARAILALETAEEQNRLFRSILSRGLTVREAEALARGKRKAGNVKKTRGTDEHLADIEKRLSRCLLTRVTVRSGRKGGAIEIRFSSPEELERILDVLLRA